MTEAQLGAKVTMVVHNSDTPSNTKLTRRDPNTVAISAIAVSTSETNWSANVKSQT